MYKVRVGNDINIQWRIFRNDSPEDFAGKTLRLLMRGTSQTIEVRDYVLEGNVVKWEYKGKDQRGPSTFTFTLIENEGKDDMFTIDKCDVLRLVSCSCQADDDDGRFDMFIDTDIVLPSNGVDGKTPVLESGDTQTLEPGSEATSEIVPNGQDEAGNPRYKVNFGIPAGEPFAYDDFTPEQIEGLKKPALDAAAVAEAAADAATKAAANADKAAKEATEAASSANNAAGKASQAAVDAGLAKTAAEEAAAKATDASEAANTAAEEASSAAQTASQTNTEVSKAEQGRVTAEEQRVAAEQTRQTEFSQLKQDAQTATQEANAAAQAANQAAESIEESLSAKQDKTDESLQTSDKTVAGAINELKASNDSKQDKLKAGTGVEITSDNTVNVTLDTTVFKVVASLPESPAAGDENKIFLVPAESTEEGNIYTEYVFVNGKWEEFGTYRSEVDLTPYMKKADAEATYQKITDNALSTTAKTVVGAINENTGNVTRIDRAVGNPTVTEHNFTVAESGYFLDVNGNKQASSSWNITDAITLNRGDIIRFTNSQGSTNNSILSKVTSDGKFIESVIHADAGKTDFFYFANSDCFVKVSLANRVLSNPYYIIKSPFNTAISDNSYMQYLHKVYEKYGAVYNAETGYWELNGLTDLTEEDMWDIYVENIGVSFGTHLNDNYMLRLWPFKNARIRFIRIEDPEYCNLSAFVFCRLNRKLEVFRCMNESGAETRLEISGRATGLFYWCEKLKDAGIINVSGVSTFIESNILSFNNCAKLSRVLLLNLKLDISFQDSPLISYESLNYLVTNAANTAAITVTVHPTTYSYLTGTAQPTEEVGGTTEEWQALVTTAQGKQISFAQPAETLEVEPLE